MVPIYWRYRKGISSQNMANNRVQYLHFRILKFPLPSHTATRFGGNPTFNMTNSLKSMVLFLNVSDQFRSILIISTSRTTFLDRIWIGFQCTQNALDCVKIPPESCPAIEQTMKLLTSKNEESIINEPRVVSFLIHKRCIELMNHYSLIIDIIDHFHKPWAHGDLTVGSSTNMGGSLLAVSAGF